METSQATAAPGAVLQLVTFGVADEEYGVDILSVQEIIRHTGIMKVPSAPDFVEGILNLRGRVIPIVDMRRRFGLEPKEPDSRTRIVVFALPRGVMGFLVDSVSEVLRIPTSMVEPPPAVTTCDDAAYIQGVGKLDGRMLILLDAAQVLSVEEMASIKRHM